MSIEQTGVPSMDMVYEKFPPIDRIRQSRVAVAECYQRIPCNPCEQACPKKAIVVGRDINDTPVLDPGRCTGCGLCLSRCPGLALFLVKLDGDTAELSLPYECLPLPRKGDRVTACDRVGADVCPAVVTEVLMPPSFDRTAVVRIAVPARHLYDVRNFRTEAGR